MRRLAAVVRAKVAGYSTVVYLPWVASLWLCVHVGAAHAQANPEQGDVELNANTRLSGGVSTSGGSSGRAHARSSSYSGGSSGGSGDLRLTGQVRFDALNVLGFARGDLGYAPVGSGTSTPLVTAGVRLLETRLFLGLGFGFGGFSTDVEGGDAGDTSRYGMGFAPMATYDLIVTDEAAFSLGGILNLAFLGETETGDVELNDDAFGFGITLLAGLRAKLAEQFAVGTDLGWGFLNYAQDTGGDTFFHGVIGMLVLETSMGI